MYQALKSLLLRVLRVPHEPDPPAGTAESLRVFRASRRYLQYRLIPWAIAQAWFVALALFAFVSLQGALAGADVAPWLRRLVSVVETFGWIALVGGVLVSYATIRLDFEMRYYMVTDRSLRIREGVWEVHEMTMTFANIQNISIEQGPLQRLFGIADVRVQSAGGGGMGQSAHGGGKKGAMRDLHVGWFRGVDDAQAIRDLVLDRLKRLRDAGLGDHDDVAQHEPQHSVASQHSSAPGPRVALLRELLDEMRWLRLAAERLASRS